MRENREYKGTVSEMKEEIHKLKRKTRGELGERADQKEDKWLM